ESKLPLPAVIPLDNQEMINEIEINLERPRTVRHGRSGQAARRNIQRHVPRVINPWCLRQSNLADDLRPHVKRGASLLPFIERKTRPEHGAIRIERFTKF